MLKNKGYVEHYNGQSNPIPAINKDFIYKVKNCPIEAKWSDVPANGEYYYAAINGAAI